jgi:PiT family inorganic phosphate transporter
MDAGLLAIGLALSAMIAWSIGANDLANSASIAVGSGALSYRKTLVVFLVGLFMGAILQGFMFMKTLGKGVIQNVIIEEAVASSLAAFV